MLTHFFFLRAKSFFAIVYTDCTSYNMTFVFMISQLIISSGLHQGEEYPFYVSDFNSYENKNHDR